MSNPEQYADDQDTEVHDLEDPAHEQLPTADLDPEYAADEYDEDEDEGEYEDEDEYEPDSEAQTPAQSDAHQQSDEFASLANLPLELTLRCGQLSLSLGELRRLSNGTVLVATGVTPGFATLCHGERVVAEGELVDVDGRLGLQITRMASLS
ncbi:FliM/FliN family flagellar motor switch protein [Pseudomonas sp. GL-B-16]|uniref:FliM/FliN family flagellar motor switch protein n=1 Tax=Pseudomonas sp. GL-B-16 TaxID=2832373 RepID=UPI001CC022C5|nr:FliM/FliN family flagellar motor switch protein [Pseudomonas sp. GL-B-16]